MSKTSKKRVSGTSLKSVLNKMKTSGGKFMTITFTKKTDGSTRIMNGQVRKDDFYNSKMNVKFIEKKSGLRTVIPQNILELSLSGKTWKVRNDRKSL